MSSTFTQIVLHTQANSRPWGRARIYIVATVVALLAALVPAASADCGGNLISGRSQVIPSVPGSVAAPASAGQKSPTSKQGTAVSIVGLWNLNFSYKGAVVDVAFDAWHADGTEVLNDFTNPINGNVCLGAWQQTGNRAYKLKHPSWYFDASGNLLGTVVIHEDVHLSSDGNSFNGTYTDDVYDLSGNLLEEFSGHVKATRIQVD